MLSSSLLLDDNDDDDDDGLGLFWYCRCLAWTCTGGAKASCVNPKSCKETLTGSRCCCSGCGVLLYVSERLASLFSSDSIGEILTHTDDGSTNGLPQSAHDLLSGIFCNAARIFLLLLVDGLLTLKVVDWVGCDCACCGLAVTPENDAAEEEEAADVSDDKRA